MELFNNVAEYYDELYPASEEQKEFYQQLLSKMSMPIRVLRIGCATGTFEHNLAKNGIDVTGIETVNELLESANRKRRTQLMAIRFFQMTTLEMTRFLGKSFYNVVSILDGRILLTHDPILMRKLFFDCKQLLVDGGTLVITLPNLEKYNREPECYLPKRESIRCTLTTRITTGAEDKKTIDQKLETGNGKKVVVSTDVPIYPLKTSEIKDFAKEAGFSSVELYSDFSLAPFSSESDYILAVIK